MHKLIPVTQLKEASTGTFFDKSHTHALNARLSRFGYQTADKHFTFFVESSKPLELARKYTIYRFNHTTGRVELWGRTRAFSTLRRALVAAMKCANQIYTK